VNREAEPQVGTLTLSWTCACDTCGDLTTVERPRRVCPFDDAPLRIVAGGRTEAIECEVYNYQRVSCDVCDYSHDASQKVRNGDPCPECGVSE